MADFSHLSKPDGNAIASYLARGNRLTDEMLNDVIDAFEPSLALDVNMTSALRRELDTKSKRKRGRPVGDVLVRRQIAIALAERFCADIPPQLVQALIDRLESGVRYTDLSQDTVSYWKRQKRDQRMFIRGLYRDFYKRLDRKSDFQHPIFGAVKLPCDAARVSQSELALLVTQDIMRTRLGMLPQSIGTMRNIVADPWDKCFVKK